MEKSLVWNFRSSSHADFEQINKGGQHLIFEDPYFKQLAEECGMPDIRQVLRFNFQEYIQRQRTLPSERHFEAVSDLATIQNYRFSRLRETFGNDIPDQSTVVKQVYFRKEHLDQIWSHYNGIPEGMYQTAMDHVGWALVTFQDQLRDLRPDDLAFRIPYAERNGSDKEFYSEVNHRWLINPFATPTEEEIRQFHSVQPSDELVELLIDCESNELRRNKAIEVIDKTIGHALLTGEPIDISGKGNIFISKEGDLWAPDILFPIPEPILDFIPEIVLRIQNNFGPIAKELNFLLNGLGFVRSINYLAALFNRPERIMLFENMDINPQTWDKVYDFLTNLSTYKQLHADTMSYHKTNSDS
ncbi:MAG TPA: hypothetical protein VLA77_03210 [Candidatus Saccharimonadales bacterium]|nr:hypothetical protein [Candidatus Saccharimonadales bacterium]